MINSGQIWKFQKRCSKLITMEQSLIADSSKNEIHEYLKGGAHAAPIDLPVLKYMRQDLAKNLRF